MELSSNVRTMPTDGREATLRRDEPEAGRESVSLSLVRRAIRRTREWLLGRQEPDGCWCAELEGDTILESEAVLLWAYLGREHSELARRAARYLVQKQLPGGGWAMYPGGGVDISGSVKAYFALKLTGHDPHAEYMQRARRAVLAHGGADAVNSFTRFYLALLGQISYQQCPAVPPEALLLPRWLPANLYAISSWSRTIAVPLSIVSAQQPVRPIEPERGIRELFRKEPEQWPALQCPGLAGGTGPFRWENFFRLIDVLLKWCQRWRLLPLRRWAVDEAQRWMLERFQRSDGLGAIFPPIIWSTIALRCLGYADESPEAQYCRKQLEDLVLDDPASQTVRLQPCKSPVWDTAIAMRALAESGVGAEEPAMFKAVQWLLDKEVSQPGDWSYTVDAQPGGWYFEYANEFYPDVDDTAMVLMALETQLSPFEARRFTPLAQRTAEAIARGRSWMLAMQNDDGGWGAFDRNNDRQFLRYIPFADHNAMIDPSTPDLTARALEALGHLGRRSGDPAVDRAIANLRRTQEPDGSWYGRWGVNFLYGTWQALTGLAAVGLPGNDPALAAGAAWLVRHQQACGGWGESAQSYTDSSRRGQGPPTASQTAWAVLGLMAVGLEQHPAVARGVEYLLRTQRDDGTWEETEFTGTGFPLVFYLRYHYYPIYFPLLALARWAAQTAAQPNVVGTRRVP